MHFQTSPECDQYPVRTTSAVEAKRAELNDGLTNTALSAPERGAIASAEHGAVIGVDALADA